MKEELEILREENEKLKKALKERDDDWKSLDCLYIDACCARDDYRKAYRLQKKVLEELKIPCIGHWHKLITDTQAEVEKIMDDLSRRDG